MQIPRIIREWHPLNVCVCKCLLKLNKYTRVPSYLWIIFAAAPPLYNVEVLAYLPFMH